MSYKILVVDDSPDIRELMSLLLKPEGFEVAEASNGLQALSMLDTERTPDLIFLDHNMDVMSGGEFLLELELKHPEILAQVPIVMMTGTELHLVPKNRATEVVAKQGGIEALLSLARHYLV